MTDLEDGPCACGACTWCARPLPMDLGGPAPGTKCDLCAEVGIDKIATCERRVGRAWAYVCGAHRYRIDGRQ